MTFQSNKAKKALSRTKEILSFLASVYSVILLLSIVASIIPQVYPIFFHPLIIEGAKYATIILISIFCSYFLLKRMERRIEASRTTLGEKVDMTTERINKRIDELDKRVSEIVDFRVKEDQRHMVVDERLKKLFGVRCPACNTWIDTDFPNIIISGIHLADGPASKSTSRQTFEVEILCPYCQKSYHIDLPHSQLFKI